MNCRNCNHPLKEGQKYCDNCGAKVIQNRLTPKILAHQVNEQFISIDNKFLQTFIDLFRRPENVIVGYIEGTRRKYIDVLQYFAISLTLAGIQVFLMTTFFKEALDFDSEFLNKVAESPGNEHNPFFNSDFESTSKYQGLIYTITLPLSALSTWLAYYLLGDRRYNFTEHLVLNLYYSGQIIIITAISSILFLILGLNYLIVTLIIFLPTFGYQFYVLKRVFKDSFWETFAKFILVLVITTVVYTLLSVLIGLLILLQTIL